MIKIVVKQGGIQFEETPLVVVGLFEGEQELEGAADAVDRALTGAIARQPPARPVAPAR